MRKLVIVSMIAASGCTIAEYGPPRQVLVAGHMVTVLQETNHENTWNASEVGAFDSVDVSRYKRNVMAIEQVSGCKVDLATIVNDYGNTTVLVQC